jgi:hypothetical protein
MGKLEQTMNATQGMSVLIALLAAVWATPALGKEYSDQAGFSFTYPDDWVAVSDPAKKGFTPRDFPPAIRKWFENNNVNLSKIAVTVISDDFAANVTVMVEAGQIRVDDSSAKNALTALSKQYESMGWTLKDQHVRAQRLGARDVLVIDLRSELAGMQLQQRVVAITGGGKTFYVTCTARAEDYSDYPKTFESILSSFHAPDPIVQRFGPQYGAAPQFDWGPALTYSAIFCVIGGAVWKIRKFATAKWKRSVAESQFDELPENGQHLN